MALSSSTPSCIGRWKALLSSSRLETRVPLPPFTDSGDLPVGVLAAPLREVLDRFGGGSPQRRAVALRLVRIYELAHAGGHVSRFIVFGSFVTNARDPNDVDVFLLMEDTFDAGALAGEARLLFDHGAAQAHFGSSVFGCAAWPLGKVRTRPWNTGRSSAAAGGVVS